MTIELIVAATSAGFDGGLGDDRVRAFGNRRHQAGVVVADGVGSVPGSDATAEAAAELAVTLMFGRDVGSAFLEFDRELERCFRPDRAGATTLVVVRADRDGLVGHFLLGNGAIIEVVPMHTGPGRVRLLWSSVALPQMGTRDGRPALASFLPLPDARVESEKGIRQVPAGVARLYLVCSDGLLSEEDRLEGGAPDGTVWQQVPTLASALLEKLTERWGEIVGSETERSAEMLQRCLDEVIDPDRVAGTLDDDTTIGAVLLRPSVRSTDQGSVAR